jgi:hypothetical protein
MPSTEVFWPSSTSNLPSSLACRPIASSPSAETSAARPPAMFRESTSARSSP